MSVSVIQEMEEDMMDMSVMDMTYNKFLGECENSSVSKQSQSRRPSYFQASFGAGRIAGRLKGIDF